MMIDAVSKEPLSVSTDGTVGPYIMVPFSQLDELCRLLDEHRVPYAVQANVISLNDEPEIAVVDLGYDGDALAVQALHDGAQ